MKKLLIALFGLMMMATAGIADPLLGTWQTIKDDNGNYGHIVISPCGDRFCGVLTQSFDSNGQPFTSENTGRQLVWDMEARGNGRYGGGKVYSPDRDKTYSGKLVLTGDSLTVQGCIIGICRDGGVWSRVN